MDNSVVWSDIYGNANIDYQKLLKILEDEHKSVILTSENQIQISDEAFIRRFLMLGTTEYRYYASEKELTMQEANKLCKIIEKGSGLLILQELIKISSIDRAFKQNPTFFALALCSRYQVRDLTSKVAVPSEVDENAKNINKNILYYPIKRNSIKRKAEYRQLSQSMNTGYQKALQQLALHAVSKICRNSLHLFMFIKYCKLISGETGVKVNSKGWGRALRVTVSNWYFNQNPEHLVMQVTKYRNFEGYNHRDLFRLCHIHPNLGSHIDHNYWKYHKEYDAIFKFVVEDNMNLRKSKETLIESKMKQYKLDDEKTKTEQQSIEMENEIEGIAELTLTKRNEAILLEKMESKETPSVETSKVLQFLKDFQQLQMLTVNDVDKAVKLINEHGKTLMSNFISVKSNQL
ncbi:unnamed protein product [Onchocerca ochengi]|uniref:TROVE domain-containing protein n=1 Tax=Onchocerca ochengi TaxID=42157 RepID=A0A182EKT1_ONCOC|nr:unnamed protein product [Onchocerca ochengi]